MAEIHLPDTGQRVPAGETVLGIELPKLRSVVFGEPAEAQLPDTERLRTLVESEGFSALNLFRQYGPETFASGHRRVVDWGGGGKNVEKTLTEVAQSLPPSTTDCRTVELIELDRIWRELAKGTSLLTNFAVSRSTLRPSTSVAVINARQEAYKELLQNPALFHALESFVSKWQNAWENNMLDFALRGWSFKNGYSDFWNIRGALKSICSAMTDSPEPQSTYLRMLREDVLELGETRLFELLTGGIVRTPAGLKTKAEVASEEGRRASRSTFVPWEFSPAVVYATLPSILLTPLIFYGGLRALEAAHRLVPEEALGKSLLTLVVLTAYGVAAPSIIKSAVEGKRHMDDASVGRSLEQLMRSDQRFDKAIDSIGRIGELVAGVNFIRQSRLSLAFPEMHDASVHFMDITGMGSPLFWTDPKYVTSDLRFVDHGIVSFTGPNSGGKSTCGRALPLNQTLAQMGLPIPAMKAVMGVADWWAYQAPQFNEQGDSEGRFGTEFARTRDVSLPAGRRSLLIFDEMAEGTTSDEKARHSRAVLEMLSVKGATTVLITHNLELAHLLDKLGMAQSIQVEFKEGNPTYRIVAGISDTSHADTIARRIAFSPEDMVTHLKDRRYLE